MKPLLPRTGQVILKTTTSSSASSITSTSQKQPVTKAPSTTPVDRMQQPGSSTVVATPAGQGGVPAWATPAFFTALANADDGGGKGAALKGGGALQVRLATMQAPKVPASSTSADIEARRERGRGLLARALHGAGVIGGRPLTAQEIAEAPVALHLTRPKAVASILEHGLRPTTGLYKNLTTWFRDAVYMFGREPTASQKFLNFSTAASEATAVIEIDLKKLDPAKLYRRVLDGAIIYVSETPIPAGALRLREAGR